MKPARKREMVDHVRVAWQVSIRRACCALPVDRSTYHYRSKRAGQAPLSKRIKEIAETRVRYGYRRIHVLLQREGWPVNVKRVYRLYREQGLQLRNKSPRRRVKAKLRDDRSPATAPNQIWAMDFVHDQLFDGRKIRILTIVDTFTRLAPAIAVRPSYRGIDVVATLDRVTTELGYPKTIRVDNVLTRQSRGKTRQRISLRRREPVASCRNKNQVASTMQGCALNHSKPRIRGNVAVLTVLKTRYATKWKARTLSTGSQGELRPHGSIRAKSFHLAPADQRTAGNRLRSERLRARRVPS